MNTQPKVSILIPVYNTARYLPKCLDSARNQTLKDIEIIPINDASPDNAAEILEEYAKKDPRIKVVTREKNGGILAARLSGIAAASGEYIVALDADDTLAPDTCRAAYAKAKKTGADIVHFCFDVQVEQHAKRNMARNVQKALRPYGKPLHGKKVFEGAFVDHLYRWNICGKFIAAEICRKAAAALPPGYYIMAEDFCFYSMMAFFANHYEPLFKKCYRYVLDVGVSAYSMVDACGFQRNCSGFTALNAVKSFLKSHDVFEQYRLSFEQQELLLVKDLMDRWEHKVLSSEQPGAFEFMCGHYHTGGLLRALLDYFFQEPWKAAAMIGKAAFLKKSRPVKKIALYLDQADSDLAAEWQKTALILERAGFVTVCVSAATSLDTMTQTDIAARVGFWEDLSKNGFDTVIHTGADSSRLFFDALAIKLYEMNLVPVPAHPLQTLSGSRMGSFLVRMKAFSLADAAVVSGYEDLSVCRNIGIRSCCIPRKSLDPVAACGRQYILFLGELSDRNQYCSILSAWEKTECNFPELRLLLPGRFHSAAAENEFRSLAAAYGLENRIQIQTEPEKWQEILMNTSGVVMTESPERYSSLLDRLPKEISCVDLTGKLPDEMTELIKENLLQDGRKNYTLEAVSEEKRASALNGLLMTLGQSADPEADMAYCALLRSSENYCEQNEKYILNPPPQGASFISFYVRFDKWVSKLLPPGSSRREFWFKAGRCILRNLPKGK